MYCEPLLIGKSYFDLFHYLLLIKRGILFSELYKQLATLVRCPNNKVLIYVCILYIEGIVQGLQVQSLHQC